MNGKSAYTSDELLEIFKEQHRLCGSLDFMIDENFVLTKETLICDWMEALDLLPWKELSAFLNKEFKITVSLKTWDTILNPVEKRTLGGLCDFLSIVAEKETLKPIKILGSECLTTAIFKNLKRNLQYKGVDVTELKPSTRIEDFLDVYDNFSPLIEEVTLTGVQVFDKLKYEKIRHKKRYKYWIDRIVPNLIYKRSVTAGEVITFRDLVQKIIENKKLGEPI